MIHPSLFLNQCRSCNYDLFTGTPCSFLSPFINYVINDKSLEFIEAGNEGDAVALACGAWAGGRKSVVIFQNSGLGNALNPLVSLSQTMKIPFIGIVTLRGDPMGDPDEPQHRLMGKITTHLLDEMKIPWAFFPDKEELVQDAFLFADNICIEKRTPFFFVMRKGSVENCSLMVNGKIENSSSQRNIKRKNNGSTHTTRTEALKIIKKFFKDDSAIIATTGKTGRELFAIEDSPHQWYMVGSMGCALPLGLGLTKSRFNGSVCVIDGDGALLMRLGNMALAGRMRPSRLVHILLDNGVHDSTGGQRTFSELVDFPLMAQACGYQNIFETDDKDFFKNAIAESLKTRKLSFIRFFIKTGPPKKLGRPTISPAEIVWRLKKQLSN